MFSISKRVFFKSFLFVLFAAATILNMSSCEKIENPTPTHELMQGVWKVDVVYDENGKDITDSVTTLLPAYLHLDDKNSINSTCGPLFMYIVYGNSRFMNIIGRIDEVFDYADLSLTEGEWFIKKAGQTDVFTCEIKMKFPAMNTLESILSDMGGVNLGFIDELIEAVIYHKFMNVGVEINDWNTNRMRWTFHDGITPVYNTKDQYGNYVLWNGISLNTFSRCTIYWKKQSKTLNQLIKDATKKE